MGNRLGRNNPWFDSNDTERYEFTEDNCDEPSLIGHWLDLYTELSDEMADNVGAAAVRAVREVEVDGRRVSEIQVQARGIAANQALVWIKQWSLQSGNPNPHVKGVSPSLRTWGLLRVAAADEIRRVVAEWARQAQEEAPPEPVIDPLPGGFEIEASDGLMSDAEDSMHS